MIRALKGVRHMTTTTVKQAVSELSIPVPWGEIRGKVWGPDHGRPVLCLHGWADNCGSFNTLLPLLPKDCRYVAVDLVGHGCSSHRPPGVLYAFPSYVMDIRRVIDALQWSKFSIIGHSMGGNIGGMFSAVYPEMVDALVLLDSYGFLPTDTKEMPEVLRQGLEDMIQFEKTMEGKQKRVYSHEKAVERLLAGNKSLSEESATILLERALVQVEGGVMFSRDFRINLKNIARISLEQSLEMRSRIRASVLIILADGGFGRMFPNTEEKLVSALLEAYKDGNNEVVRVPGNHHVHLNEPEVVAPFVSNFLQTKAPANSAELTGALA
ncbi:serine hydrolase-like protein isoform X2 [Cololabis saira]|uniref:serine hydrolase-like protein isoform X2 n=1 Tax=Cololabis saira TaxID=129043 RepID=UPI002AD2C902|nr:serine hydrolase-like protein isoform X2 [Cololabis saira]